MSKLTTGKQKKEEIESVDSLSEAVVLGNLLTLIISSAIKES